MRVILNSLQIPLFNCCWLKNFFRPGGRRRDVSSLLMESSAPFLRKKENDSIFNWKGNDLSLTFCLIYQSLILTHCLWSAWPHTNAEVSRVLWAWHWCPWNLFSYELMWNSGVFPMLWVHPCLVSPPISLFHSLLLRHWLWTIRCPASLPEQEPGSEQRVLFTGPAVIHLTHLPKETILNFSIQDA